MMIGSFSRLFIAMALFCGLLSAERYDQGLDAAELIIRLAPSITRDLAPPVTGAERTVTHATMHQENGLRIYYIEGQDIHHSGRVYGNYRLTVQKTVAPRNNDWAPIDHDLSVEAKHLIEVLLNGLYDVADLETLTHNKVNLTTVAVQNSSEENAPEVYEFIGINNVCEHDELNTFKLVITRTLERNRAHYETSLIKPWQPSLHEDEKIEE